MEEEIKKILTASLNAPSGDNCQPWRFRLIEKGVEVHNDPEADNSLYNYEMKASLLANGAMVENIVTSADYFGYRADVQTFPDKSNPNYIAQILFEHTGISEEELFPAIANRKTNRRPYSSEVLEREVIEKILKTVQKNSTTQVTFITEPTSILKLAKIGSINEKIVLENAKMRNFFFNHVVWSATAMSQHRQGIFIKTLEMNPVQQIIFKICGNPFIMRHLVKIGFANFIANENSKIYTQSGAVGVIFSESDTDDSYLDAGRLLERIWLKATFENLSIHPMGGVALLTNLINSGNVSGFERKHIELLNNAHTEIKKICSLSSQGIVFMFRIGKGGEPSATSLKKTLDDLTL